MKTQPTTTEAMMFFATHAFHRPDGPLEGFDGASDDAVFCEDERDQSIWVFDPENETGSRLEKINADGTSYFWIFDATTGDEL